MAFCPRGMMLGYEHIPDQMMGGYGQQMAFGRQQTMVGHMVEGQQMAIGR
jgi:hypothetical protein